MKPTVEDYIKAAKIVAGCKPENLPTVRHILQSAGFDVGKEPENVLIKGDTQLLLNGFQMVSE